MKHPSRWLLSSALVLAPFLADCASAQQIPEFPLLASASASGPSGQPAPGGYQLFISGTFGGATLALVETYAGQNITLGSYTSAPSTPPCFVIPQGASLQMTVTSGSPSGLNAKLGGTGYGGCPGSGSGGGGDASASNQSTQITAEQAIQAGVGAPADSSCGSDSGTCSLIAQLKRLNAAITTLNTAVAAAVPAGTNLMGGASNYANIGGSQTAMISCQSKATYDASTSGSTELVALTSTQTIYICGYTLFAAGTVNVELDYGTGTACATGNAKITPAYQLTAQTGKVEISPFYIGSKTAASNALCLKTSAGVAVQAEVYYTKF